MPVCKGSSVFCLVFVFVLTFSLTANAQYATCIVTSTSQNQNRKVLAPVNGNHVKAECPGDPSLGWSWITGVASVVTGAWVGVAWGGAGGAIGAALVLNVDHTIPYGNWGVSSNVGTKQDGAQFQGWDEGDKIEWNSCTSEFPPTSCSEIVTHNVCLDENDLGFVPIETTCPAGYTIESVTSKVCRHYNFNFDPGLDGFTQQMTNRGVNNYGAVGTPYQVSCPRYYTDGTWRGGCKDIVGTTVTVAQNFMTMYELDPFDEDEVVQSLYYPNRSATLGTCDAWSCLPGFSSWANPTSYNTPISPPLVDAQMRIRVRGELFETAPYGDCDQFDCPPCDPVTGCAFPCIPTCFIPPCI